MNFQKGDRVVCVSLPDFCVNLTLGEYYEVLEDEVAGWVKVTADDRVGRSYLIRRFRLADSDRLSISAAEHGLKDVAECAEIIERLEEELANARRLHRDALWLTATAVYLIEDKAARHEYGGRLIEASGAEAVVS